MSKHSHTTDPVSGSVAGRSCWTWMNTLQVAVGLLLVLASAFGYSLLKHPILMIPGIMGALLLFFGAKAAFVCRNRFLFHNHHHSNGMPG